MISYPVKENPISLAVSEILWYTQTDILTDEDPVTFIQRKTDKMRIGDR